MSAPSKRAAPAKAPASPAPRRGAPTLDDGLGRAAKSRPAGSRGLSTPEKPVSSAGKSVAKAGKSVPSAGKSGAKAGKSGAKAGKSVTSAASGVSRAKKPSPEAGRSAAAPEPAKAPGKRAKASPGDLLAALRVQHPEAHCELDYTSPWTLLVATVLSAQTTDKLVNSVTPSLFERWPTPAALAAADPPDVGEHLRSRGMGFFNVKSKNIVKLATQVAEQHGGVVPRTLAELVKLSGVGKKTANLILGECFQAPEGVVVDTHVLRVSQRLGLSKKTEAEAVSEDLAKLFPRDQWMALTHAVIFHGRRVCAAIAPACASCGASSLCPSAFDAVNVGRKAGR